MTTIKDLNLAEPSQAYRLVEPLIERAPSVAEQVILRRPFTGVTHLIDTITDTLFTLTSTERVGLFKAHPELAPNNPLAMTKASQSEQARLELVSRDNEYQVRLTKMNAAYQERFGFPFITALVGHTSMETVIVEFERRLESSLEDEMDEALRQVAKVSSARARTAFVSDPQSEISDVEARQI